MAVHVVRTPFISPDCAYAARLQPRFASMCIAMLPRSHLACDASLLCPSLHTNFWDCVVDSPDEFHLIRLIVCDVSMLETAHKPLELGAVYENQGANVLT